ncbi:hypothetical protein ACFX2J_002660 [Malus domestica]
MNGRTNMLKLNLTNIVPIPKTQNPELLSHFRPVSLRRKIQDNIIIAHVVFHFLKLRKVKKKYELGIKSNMNNAYDRVEWDFLKAVMVKIGFDSKWVELVMSCVSTVHGVLDSN